MFANHHRTGEVHRRFLAQPRLVRLKARAVAGDFYADQTDLVRANDDDVAVNDRRGDVPRERGLQRHAREEFTIARIEADQSITGETDQLPDAGNRGDDRRGEGRLVVLRFPKHSARALLETNDTRTVRASHTGIEKIAVNQWGTVVAMPRRARRISLFTNEHCAEVVGEIRSPDQLAIRDVEALQFAFARQRIDAVAVHDRRAARPARSLHVAKAAVDFLFPKLLCI